MPSLYLLGTGTPTPTPNAFGTAYVLELQGEYLMIDCGPAATHKLVKVGLFPTQIDHLFFTHHHFDHVTGVSDLAKDRPELSVLGSRYDMERDRIPGQTRALEDGETFEYAGHQVRILEVPGHTLGAIAYVVDGDVFTGDTLFLAGCGRVFEGSMEMMSQSLARFRELPAETLVYCGHEYTLNNLRFALHVEPDKAALVAAMERAQALRDAEKPTVPKRMADELLLNPFLRFDDPALMADRSAVENFTKLRLAKDSF